MADICAICHETLEGEQQIYTLTCDHTFHTNCILTWFRRGAETCPTCRDIEANPSQYITGLTLRARATHLRKKARYKNCPSDLRKIIDRLKASEKQEKEAQKIYREFRREHKDVLADMKKLRDKMYKSSRKSRELNRLLGLYTNENMRLPPLNITYCSSHFF